MAHLFPMKIIFRGFTLACLRRCTQIEQVLKAFGYLPSNALYRLKFVNNRTHITATILQHGQNSFAAVTSGGRREKTDRVERRGEQRFPDLETTVVIAVCRYF